MPTPRLVPTQDGWWYLNAGKAAHLPPAAVVDGTPTEPALETLRRRGFFDAPRQPFGLTVLTATSCNLGCAYCFQNTESATDAANPFAPSRISRRFLEPNDIDHIVAFTQDRMSALGADRLILVLFGGEPLLNPRGCLLLLKRLSRLGLTDPLMISNAVLLTPDLARRLYTVGLRRIQVTFDGSRTDHDKARLDRRGSGTYDKILANVVRAARETTLNWRFRVNASHRNLDGLDQLIDDIATLPLPQPASLDLALLDDVRIGTENHLTYDGLTERFIELIDHALDAGLSVPLLGTPATACLHCSGLGGTTGAVVNADGVLYSCWETVGRPEWAVGDITDGYLPRAQIEDKWVTCDYRRKSHGTAEAARRFYDQVDCHILNRVHGRQIFRSVQPISPISPELGS